MAFGRRRGGKENKDTQPEPAPEAAEAADEAGAGLELEGPFDVNDFDDPATAEVARLDLGSVLLPLPAGGQMQVELTQDGVPSAVWVVTANGRFTIAAYAAPKSEGLWRQVAGELADSLRRDAAQVSIVDNPPIALSSLLYLQRCSRPL